MSIGASRELVNDVAFRGSVQRIFGIEGIGADIEMKVELSMGGSWI